MTKAGQVATAGIAGAVIGAGAAVAATKILSNKKTRANVMKTVSAAKDNMMHRVKTAARELKTKAKEEVTPAKTKHRVARAA